MPVLESSEGLRRSLEDVAEKLEDQFGAIDGGIVHSQVGLVASRLLERARFADFVPLLTERYARERLAPMVLDAPAHPSV